MSTMCCPLCSSQLPSSPDVMIDDGSGFIAANGAVVRLSETEFAIFHHIWKHQPRVISREQLMAELYWKRSGGDEPQTKIVDVLVCKIREKLSPLNITIDTVWGRGYRVLPQPVRQKGAIP